MSGNINSFAEAIKAEQVRLLYKQAPSTLILGFIAAVVATALLWNTANLNGLLLWIGALGVLTGAGAGIPLPPIR